MKATHSTKHQILLQREYSTLRLRLEKIVEIRLQKEVIQPSLTVTVEHPPRESYERPDRYHNRDQRCIADLLI